MTKQTKVKANDKLIEIIGNGSTLHRFINGKKIEYLCTLNTERASKCMATNGLQRVLVAHMSQHLQLDLPIHVQ